MALCTTRVLSLEEEQSHKEPKENTAYFSSRKQGRSNLKRTHGHGKEPKRRRPRATSSGQPSPRLNGADETRGG